MGDLLFDDRGMMKEASGVEEGGSGSDEKGNSSSTSNRLLRHPNKPTPTHFFLRPLGFQAFNEVQLQGTKLPLLGV